MRFLLSAIGSRGDVQPVVALAMQLRALDQEVRLCAPPDFAKWIGSFGLPFVPIGPEWRRSASSVRQTPRVPASPTRVRQLAAASLAVQFEVFSAAVEGCDAVVAVTALQVAARSVAELHGLPYVFATWSPAVFPSPHHPPPPLPQSGQAPAPATADNAALWAENARHFNDTFGAALDARRAAVGLPPAGDVRSHMFTDRPWLAADPALAPWPGPADLDVVQTGAWILPDERALPPELESFLAAGEPPVYFGFGSIAVDQHLTTTLVRAARALGRRVLVSRGWASLAAVDGQPDCLAVGEVNQQALFPRVAAVVHHGGAGTTTAAARAGAPQVVVPQVYDQHYFARRVDALGVGSAHEPVPPSVDSLVAALTVALRPEVANRARALAAAVRADGAATAAQRLVAAHAAAPR
ncbi:glycosyltransferase [Micromonospora carbonacea]|uniref:glycosyltransferase n=1 Tax=Micromonospora carbonacea TaxID=47853 RepID=UPI003715FD6F